MAAFDDPLLVTVAVVAVLVAVMGLNVLTSRRLATMKAQDAAKSSPSSLLARFAVHRGSVVGEVIAQEGDQLVLKQAGVFMLVPRAGAQERDGEVHLEGDIDWDAAKAAGAAWHASHRADSGDVDAVAGKLTTSADVRNPALESTRKE